MAETNPRIHTGTIIIHPRGHDSVLIVDGATFVLRGRLLSGLRSLIKPQRARSQDGGN